MKLFYRILNLTVIILWINFGRLFCQTITGIVSDEKKNPLAGASVYIDGTTIGTTTDVEGRFFLDPKVKINSSLVVSFVGYQTQIINNIFEKSEFIIILHPEIISLKEVQVNALALIRKQKLEIFRQQFLGRTKAGKSCKILNEDDLILDFDLKSSRLIASARKPLIIQNPFLGYILNFNLIDFYVEYNPERIRHSKDLVSKNITHSFILGTSLFKDTGIINNIIGKNRVNSYLGSRRHFFWSLLNNSLKENGFNLIKVPEDNFIIQDTLGIKRITLISKPTDDPSKPVYKSYRLIYENLEKSKVIFRTKTFFVDEYGNNSVFVDGYGNISLDVIEFEGAIAEKRIGDLLPKNF